MKCGTKKQTLLSEKQDINEKRVYLEAQIAIKLVICSNELL